MHFDTLLEKPAPSLKHSDELKTLAKLAGIAKRLTFHTARHSFADKARRMISVSRQSQKLRMNDWFIDTHDDL